MQLRDVLLYVHSGKKTSIRKQDNRPYRTSRNLDFSKLVQPVFEDNPGLVDLYYEAWKLSWEHVLEREGTPSRCYLDEAFSPHTIWIWDSCFMSMFARYASQQFPVEGTLDNCYQILHEQQPSAINIQHPDNPPLFAWVEWQLYQITGNKERLHKLILDKAWLQKHYRFIENSRRWSVVRGANVRMSIRKENYGYLWHGTPSGMDNTPRGRNRYHDIYWLDLLAMQLLSAQYISRMAKELSEDQLAAEYKILAEEGTELQNRYYWDDEDGLYYDISRKNPRQQCKVKTPASFWPMLAGACRSDQALKMASHLESDGIFGGRFPWPSVSRDDPDYHASGHYWKGGIWLPLAYMGTQALKQYGFHDIADTTAERLLNNMYQTWQQFEPHSIWEAYAPEAHRPATTEHHRKEQLVRPDFCGWSALGPINMLIENVLGFENISAPERTIHWRIYQQCRHGLNNLSFGDTVTSLLYTHKPAPEISVTSNKPYTLKVFYRGEQRDFNITRGFQHIRLSENESNRVNRLP